MGKIIGIDLGTTNSCVAIFEGKNTTVISNSEGKKTIPSIVAVTSNGFKVGESAKRQSITNPQRTVFSIKRFIEEKYSAVKKKVEVIPYNLQASPDGKLIALIDGKQYTPQEISAYILQKMKKTAEEYLDIQISEAGLPPIGVTFDIDKDRLLTIMAEDGDTGNTNMLRIERSGNLSSEDIERMKAEAQANEREDKKRLEWIQAYTRFEQNINQIKSWMEELACRMTDEDISTLNSLIDQYTKICQEENHGALIRMVEKLNTACEEARKNLYKESV